MPVVREVLMILVMTGTRASRYCLVRDVGIGSSLQLFEAVFNIIAVVFVVVLKMFVFIFTCIIK